MEKARKQLLIAAILLAPLVFADGGAAPANSEGENEMAPGRHFTVTSSAKSPSAPEISAHLERTWRVFRDLFDVEPRPVRVVLSTVASSAQATSRADQGNPAAGSVIAWTMSEGEDLSGQGFSDLSHEIAHIYFLELMGGPQGLHQDPAWLHEAVACYHEGEPFVENRNNWIRERIQERIPLEQFFEMKNPVKLNPMVELTVQLHEQLHRGEISVTELNDQVSRYASTHAEELAQSGIRNMTYYAQSLSLFEFLLEREGKVFVRTMVRKLRDGASMDQIIRERDHYRDGISSLEEEWVRRVQAGQPFEGPRSPADSS